MTYSRCKLPGQPETSNKFERRPAIIENAGEAKGLSYSPSLRYESPRLSTPILKSKKLPIDITAPVR
jgi:hypothetical protein